MLRIWQKVRGWKDLLASNFGKEVEKELNFIEFEIKEEEAVLVDKIKGE